MTDPMTLLAIVKECRKESHQQYLNNWEIKTQVAEADGEWTPEIQHLVLENLEQITSTAELLATVLETFLEKRNDQTTL